MEGARPDPNIVYLRDYVDAQQKSFERLVEHRFEAVERAIGTAKSELDRRLEGMNEFREQLRSQALLFQSRNENELEHERMEEDIKQLMLSRAVLAGKASQTSFFVTLALAIIGAVMALLSLIL